MAATITTRDPAAEAPVPAVAASNVMALYWELASVDPLVRQKAADSLLRALHAFQLQHQASHPSASSTTATEDNLDELCAKDVSYGLKRLLRGLPSSRDGARQGFAVALTELLRGLDFLNVTTVLSLLTKLTQTEGAKGQEEREVLFGRIFGIMAICQAGMLSRPTTTQADIDTIVTSLLKFASSKSYLRETCFRVLLTVVEETKGTALEKGVVDAIIPAVLVNEIENPEDLWFALAMQAAHPEYDWATVLPSWKHSRVLHRKNQTQLIEILKQSTYASPRVHSVWDALFDLLLQNQKESAAAKSSHNVALQDLWIQLDDALYSSTHERKHLGMLLFQRLLARVDSADVAFVFTPQLLRTLINNLAKQDNYLHKVAKQTATVMSKLAKERKEIALQLVLQLVGKNGHQRFDIITKTKTVDTILGSLEEKDILTYVTYLQETFLNQKDAETDPATVQSHRHWALNQMVLLLKNGRIPKAENWVKAVARFVCLHAFYDVQKDDPKDSSVKKPVPAVSEVTRAACIEKLSALLGTLTTMIMKDNSGM
ncbi:DNA-directed DNA polymerase [Thoreauomyces humboldtii]|nr:DNA-directed DNA polymerase [Thoreauomyces humboldtii]